MPITMTVKAIDGAVVYDIDGNRISETRFVDVPISAGVVEAVKVKDLEEVEEKDLPHRVMDDIARREQARQKAPPLKPRKHGHHSDSALGG